MTDCRTTCPDGIPERYDAQVAYEPHIGPHECGQPECHGWRGKPICPPSTPTQESA